LTKDVFGIGFDMLFSELHQLMANKVTFVGFRGGTIALPTGSTLRRIQSLLYSGTSDRSTWLIHEATCNTERKWCWVKVQNLSGSWAILDRAHGQRLTNTLHACEHVFAGGRSPWRDPHIHAGWSRL